MQTRQTLSSYTLPCALAMVLIFCMSAAEAAPAGERTTAAEGLTTTLEISKIGADSTNSIPTEFSLANVENAQTYASTEVDTEAELAPTSLPMTSEEIALAEVAAVVAELTTATAADMKAQEQASEEERERQVRRRVEEAKLQAIEPEITSAVKILQNEKDGYAATARTTSFTDVIGTTTTTAQLTTAAPPTTTDGPAILNELVRAAAAANEILAAALNAATMAGTNISITTTVAAASADTTTTTTTKPDRAANTEAAIGDGLLAVSDSETLPEGEVIWQPSEIETTSKATGIKTTINFDMADAATTTPTTAVATDATHNEPTPNANISNEISGDNLSIKLFESEGWHEAVTNSPWEIITVKPKVPSEPTATVLVAEDTTKALETQNNTEISLSSDSTILELEHFSNTSNNQETKNTFDSVDYEGAESNRVITTKEATDTTEHTAQNEIEGETYDIPLSDSATTDANQVPETATDAAINDESTNKTTTFDEVSHRSTSESTTVDNSIIPAEFEIAKVEEVKRANFQENQPNAIENEIRTTPKSQQDPSPDTTELLEIPNSTEISSPDSTDSLETLIAVESEARAPNKFIRAEEENVEAEKVATINAPPEAPTAIEETTAQTSADTTTITIDILALAKENIAVGPTTGPEVAVSTIAPEEATTTEAEVEENVAKESSKEVESDVRVIISASTKPNTDDETTAAISINDSTTAVTTEATSNENELTRDEWFTKTEKVEITESANTPEATVSVTERPATHIGERVEETIVPATEPGQSSTETPLAAFTTTPKATEEFLQAETTAKDDLEAVLASGSSGNVREATTLRPVEYTDLLETSTRQSESEISYTTTTIKSAELPQSNTTTTKTTTAAAVATEAGIEAITTTKIEVETPASTEQQAAELGTTTDAALAEEPLYRRKLDARRRQVSENASAVEETNVTLETVAETSEAITTTARELETTTAALPTTTTTAATEATTTSSAKSTYAAETTNAGEPDITTATTTKITEPETTRTTTSTTSAPASTTTTTTLEPETTTTTTTLSPMSLIIAEHEARSLERTPPRVSRIVSDDGVEVLSGYSIVHHMHAAAIAALTAAAGA